MPTTTSYGTWSSRAVRYSLTVDQTVGDALNGEYTDEQVTAVTRAYRDAINAALPDSVSLNGDEFYGNAHEADCTDQADFPHDADGRLDIAAIVETVDFWAIVEQVTG
jgi:hypothetical protein